MGKWLPCIVYMLIGFILGWIVAANTGWMYPGSNAHWWEIATAIGTVGAVVVALIAASAESIRRYKSEHAQAKLTAVSLKISLLAAAKLVRESAALLRNVESEEIDELPIMRDKTDRLIVAIEKAIAPMSLARDELVDQKITKIIRMPNNAALRTSEQIAELRSILLNIEKGGHAQAILLANNKKDLSQISRWAERCDALHRKLIKLAKECAEYGRICSAAGIGSSSL